MKLPAMKLRYWVGLTFLGLLLTVAVAFAVADHRSRSYLASVRADVAAAGLPGTVAELVQRRGDVGNNLGEVYLSAARTLDVSVTPRPVWDVEPIWLALAPETATGSEWILMPPEVDAGVLAEWAAELDEPTRAQLDAALAADTSLPLVRLIVEHEQAAAADVAAALDELGERLPGDPGAVRARFPKASDPAGSLVTLDLEWVAGLRALASFERDRVVALARQGRRGEALRHVGRIRSLGLALQADAETVVEWLVGMGIEQVGLAILYELAPHLEIGDLARAELSKLARELADTRDLLPRRLSSLDGELALKSADLDDVVDNANFVMRPMLRGNVARATAYLLSHRQAVAKAPTLPALRESFEPPAWLDDGSIWSTPASLFAGDMRPYDTTYFRHVASRRMTAVAVAAAGYRVERGRLPATLSDLVPDYLTEVPVDPMAVEAPLKLGVSQDGRPIVYSVGEDGVDDLGGGDDGVVYLDPGPPGGWGG